MRRQTLPIEQLSAWMRLNGVQLNGVAISSTIGGRGSGVIATRQHSSQDPILMTVPPELVLSMENIWVYAKADQHLLQVLEAMSDYSRTARGAILIFLLLQLTHNHTEGKIGVANPFSQYVKYLPEQIPLPTFWNEDERALLEGTSLEAALEAKLKSLDREFTLLRERTLPIAWCKQHWWDAQTGQLTFDDWKHVDAVYRSRALDLPGTGHATVPCIDMANHASGDDTSALYETSVDGKAVLVLQEGKQIDTGNEVTITYGDEKGACEILFSYGFLEDDMESAKELFLDLEIPHDDPLRIVKKAASKSAPGFRLFQHGNSVDWEGSFVWLLCVNEEDGLGFKLLATYDGDGDIAISWKEQEIEDLSVLRQTLCKDVMWDVFQLRAITTLQARVEQQLLRLESRKPRVGEIQMTGDVRAEIKGYAVGLRELEETLMLSAYEDFEPQKIKLLDSRMVQEYLGIAQGAGMPKEAKEDFS
ncbi:MAG: hypothetical protein Q9217_000097 [Psora testacea]